MNLPFRILDEAGSEPVLSVDGAFGAPGLELSHWPGNRTPAALKRDLSTGIALAFDKLPAQERERLCAGLVAIANNHVDTDGLLALFALQRPAEALAREAQLLAAAEAGDRFRTPTEEAFVLDQIVTALFDEERSPWRAECAGLERRARQEWVSRRCVERLPAWLDGQVAEFEPLWRAPLERLRDDRRDLELARCDDLVHLSSILWSANPEQRSSAPGALGFDPGRHALFGRTRADRVVVLAPSAAGTSCRLIVGTGSFFELVEEVVPARPDLEALAAQLNALEGTRPEGECAWRCDVQAHASPELWFGLPKTETFPEHAGAWLRPSRLELLRLKSLLLESLRAAFVMSDEEAEATGDDWMKV